MFERFFPGSRVDSAYGIDYDDLYAKGYRGIIYDIDNTLVEHDAPATQRAIDLFARLKAIGFHTLTLSNNKESRVKMFCDAVGSPYLYRAAKPSKRGYIRAMEVMGTTPATTLLIGDQLFTDIWGANRCGIRSILVKPIHPKERFQIVLKRIPERLILFFYSRSLKETGNKTS